MKPYMILNVTDEGNVSVATEGETRDEAFGKLADVAVVDDIYIECRVLGTPIVPKERKAVTLSRVAMTEEAPELEEVPEEEVPEQEEAPEQEEKPATPPRRRRRQDEEEG